jgi:hypothetical protein
MNYWTRKFRPFTPADRRPRNLGREAYLGQKPERHAFYSRHYDRLKMIGHTRPTPEFGAPALIWHVAFWPLHDRDPQNVLIEENDPKNRKEFDIPNPKTGKKRVVTISKKNIARLDEIRPPDKRTSKALLKAILPDGFHEYAVDQYYEHTKAQDGIFKTFLHNLQDLGRAGAKRENFERLDAITFKPPLKERRYDGGEFFEIISKETVGFTIWWTPEGPIRGTTPGPDAIRVRVQATTNPDFSTLSFFIDVNGSWKRKSQGELDQEPRTASSEAGERLRFNRQIIIERFETIERICGKRVGDPVVEMGLIPEDIRAPADAAALLEANRFLYNDLWRQFCIDFEIGSAQDPEDLAALVGSEDEARAKIFANFRGVVLATEGLGMDAEDKDPGTIDWANLGARHFAKFKHSDKHKKDKGDEKDRKDEKLTNEANAVIKGYWPFIRRMAPDIDFRDVIACGVFDWRAIYITPLGALNEYDEGDESEDGSLDVPHGNLRSGERNHQPVRYLFLTKGQPHRKQIGRIVDRINAMGTIRIYALKDWSVLQNASSHVRMRGQELDQIIRDWTEGRMYIDLQYEESRKKGRNLEREHDERDEWIAEYTRDVETRLLSIGSALDTIGQRSIGGIHFRINRSRYYVKEFLLLLETLRIGNIPTWLSYQNFVDRGLQPAFDSIHELGLRLDSLRRRLQAVTEGIQTSALVAQASATRQNTTQLRRISKDFIFSRNAAGLITGFVALFINKDSIFYKLVSNLDFVTAQEAREIESWSIYLYIAVSAVLLWIWRQQHKRS